MQHDRGPVVVVGAGIIGLTAAWRALEAGATVTVLDPAPGQGATFAAAGMLGPAMEADHGEAYLARAGTESVALWPGFAGELEQAAGLAPGGLGLDTSGTLAVAYDGDDLALLRRRLTLHQDFGLGSEEISVSAARDREPSLGPRIAGAAWIPGDHQVDPRRVHQALLTVITTHPRATLLPHKATSVPAAPSPARRSSAQPGDLRQIHSADARRSPGCAEDRLVDDGPLLARQTDVVASGAGASTSVEPPVSAQVAAVRDDTGAEHPAGTVILAAGHATSALHPAAPTRPVPGTTLRLEADATAGPSVVVRGTVQGRPIYVVPRPPRPDGRREIVVGATADERAATTRTRSGDVFALLRDARALVPSLDEADLIEATTRSRPGTPDNLPLVGEVSPGLFLATGHYRSGVLLAPHTAAAIDSYLAPRQAPGSTPAKPPHSSATPLRPTGDPA